MVVILYATFVLLFPAGSSPVDKNTNKLIMVCPVFAYNNARATFLENNTNYKVISTSSSDTTSAITNLISIWHRFYHSHNWHLIHTWPKSFDFPYAYTIPKWKDVALRLPTVRSRPIVSCVAHPCRQLFRCVGQVILFCLQKIDCLHISLWKTQDLKPWILALSNLSSLPYGTNTRFLCGPGDIANCFDRLSHTYILDSLQWLFASIYQKHRSRGGRFHVNHSTNRADFGRAFDSCSCCEFDSNDAFNVVLFALDNSFFRLGNHLLRQILGSPMGAQMSSSLAMLVCIRGEHLTLSSLGNDVKLITAKRYVDDVAALIFYKHNDIPSLEKAKKILATLRNCYHSSLIVKAGDVIGNSFTFLDSIISCSDHKVSLAYYNKNHHTILSTPPHQAIIRFTPFNSFGPDHSKINVISNLLSRIHNCSQSDAAFYTSACALLTELILCASYPPRFICSRIYALASAKPPLPHLQHLLSFISNFRPDTALMFIRTNFLLTHNTHFADRPTHSTPAQPIWHYQRTHQHKRHILAHITPSLDTGLYI